VVNLVSDCYTKEVCLSSGREKGLHGGVRVNDVSDRGWSKKNYREESPPVLHGVFNCRKLRTRERPLLRTVGLSGFI